MKEYIEREALLQGIDEFHHTSHIQSLTRDSEEAKMLWRGIHSGVNYCRNHILGASSADVEHVRHGKWEWNKHGQMYCSLCELYPELAIEKPYCPHCGAKMDGGKK